MLETEKRNPATTHIDTADTATMLRMMQDANRRSVDAVGEALDAVGKAVDAAAEALRQGGRRRHFRTPCRPGRRRMSADLRRRLRHRRRAYRRR